MLLEVVVHPADIQDRDGARLLMTKLSGRFHELKLIWADGGYSGQLVDWVSEHTGWALEIVRRPRDRREFAVLPREMGSGTDIGLAGSMSQVEQGLRGFGE